MIKKLRVTVDGKPYEVTVELSDEPESAVSASAPPPAVAPPTISIPAPKPADAPASVAAPAPSGPGSVVSPLAGLVVQIAVAVGQEVKEGDRVLTLEAMKMNTVVNAPKAGKIADIKVVVGDAVSEGQVVAVIS